MQCDFKITRFRQWSNQEYLHRELLSHGVFGNEEPFVNNLGFKYLIDIDGNSNSWPGFFLKLASGSCVLKVDSPFGFSQWYYKYLKPWVHYVPIKSNLRDFYKKIDWALSHPRKCQEIAQNSYQFIHSKSSQDWARAAIFDLQSQYFMKPWCYSVK